MATKFGAIGAWMGRRPLAVAAIALLAFHAAGSLASWPESTPPPEPRVKKPATAPAPAPAPVSAPAPPEQALVVKRILPIKGPFHAGDWVWDDKGVPDGPVVITVDLAAQTLSVFRDGYEIGAAVIIYGADNLPTPLGVFPITEKDADHVSNLYDAPMPYMLRLTNDGISIHGSEVAWGYATHGCIGVPVQFAKRLFAQARIGDRVFVTRGRVIGLGQAIAQR